MDYYDETRSIRISQENEDLGSGRNDTGHHVYNEGHEEVLEYLKQERLKDADMQRKRHETESKSIEVNEKLRKNLLVMFLL